MNGLSGEYGDLRGGVVLAELGGHGDGPYCARHGAGAALVILGTYIVDPGDSVPYSPHFVFKPGRRNYTRYLEENVAAARESGARVGVSVISVEMHDSIEFLQAAQAAGADYASLCIYSVMEMFTSRGLGVAMYRPENRSLLLEWSRGLLRAIDIPLIFKIGGLNASEAKRVIRTITSAGGRIIHIAVSGTSPGSAGLALIEALEGTCPFLIAGGGVRDVDGARRVLASGADAVSIATAAMKDPDLCGRIQRQLRGE